MENRKPDKLTEEQYEILGDILENPENYIEYQEDLSAVELTEEHGISTEIGLVLGAEKVVEVIGELYFELLLISVARVCDGLTDFSDSALCKAVKELIEANARHWYDIRVDYEIDWKVYIHEGKLKIEGLPVIR